MASFTKSAAAAVVEKSMRDMGRVQTTMTAAAVVALLSGMTARDLRDMLSSGVNAIGDGMIGKLVPLATRIMGDYSGDVSEMTAAAARDHIAADIETRKVAAGNFNALTCRAKNEMTPDERRAVKERDNHVAALEGFAAQFKAIAATMPEDCDPATRLLKAAAEADSTVAIAGKASVDLALTEGANLATFRAVNASAAAAVGLAEAIRDNMTADDKPEAEKPEAEKPEAEKPETVDPVATLCGQIVNLAKSRDTLDRIAAALAEAEATFAAAADAAAAAVETDPKSEAAENREKVAA